MSDTTTTITDHQVIKALTRNSNNTATATTTAATAATTATATPIDHHPKLQESNITQQQPTIIKPSYSYTHLKKTTSNFFKRTHHSINLTKPPPPSTTTTTSSSSSSTLSQPNTPIPPLTPLNNNPTYYQQQQQQLRNHQQFSRVSLCSHKPINLYQEEEEPQDQTEGLLLQASSTNPSHHLLRNTPSNRWTTKPNQLLNRLRKKRSLLSSSNNNNNNSQLLAGPSPNKEQHHLLPSLGGPQHQQDTPPTKPGQHKILAAANRLAHPASKSLSNINLSWLDSQRLSSASALSTSINSHHPKTTSNAPSLDRLNRSSTISSTRTSTSTLTTTAVLNRQHITTPTDGHRPSRAERDHPRPSFLLNRARQTIYLPIEPTSDCTATISTPIHPTNPLPDPAPAPRSAPTIRAAPNNRHSPTQLALIQLDQILRHGPPPPPTTTSSEQHSRSLGPAPSPSSHLLPISQRSKTPVYALSPPSRPARKPTLHQRTLSSELDGLLIKPSSTPVPSSSGLVQPAQIDPTLSASSSLQSQQQEEAGPQKRRNVPIQPHVWKDISISAASKYHHLHLRLQEHDQDADGRRASVVPPRPLSPDRAHVADDDGLVAPAGMFPLPPSTIAPDASNAKIRSREPPSRGLPKLVSWTPGSFDPSIKPSSSEPSSSSCSSSDDGAKHTHHLPSALVSPPPSPPKIAPPHSTHPHPSSAHNPPPLQPACPDSFSILSTHSRSVPSSHSSGSSGSSGSGSSGSDSGSSGSSGSSDSG
ncbi:hypothetical protein PGT21_034182 [Puccinia graminis f. sp. tritici]|uniref:Uncharacterized protein n=1 Tax=Puccinia graminis f. sp. tritici TaxID=56615 RepID=A0A5B0N7D6_PUCGR|nr:hypothetical protein PGTUg99_014258 [Puccinia graminis f. sp. tritici]KAA1084682.1 hypothetical protein PGT21_034182 [Puccinia graminis f. sp. tritici]